VTTAVRPFLPSLGWQSALLTCVLLTTVGGERTAGGQQSKRPAPSGTEAAKNPAQIELLETKYRFEANGDSQKEVHTRVRINNELGVRQFGRLNFDFNRSFQSVELPLVRITHQSGGVADILPSAMTENLSPAVADAPAYQDVRVKSVRVLGLEPGDSLEYRVITITRQHPLAPDFWLDHTFDRSGIVTAERFEIDLPAARKVQLHVRTQYTYTIDKSEDSKDARVVYRWVQPQAKTPPAVSTNGTIDSKITDLASISSSSESDVVLSTFAGWPDLSMALGRSWHAQMAPSSTLATKARELTVSSSAPSDQLSAIYDFVSKNVRTVDLPPGATGFHLRAPEETLSSGSGLPAEKCMLLSALAWAVHVPSAPALASTSAYSEHDLVLPSKFTNVLVVLRLEKSSVWLDPAIEVAPFGAISAALRGKPALLVASASDIQFFENLPAGLPYPSVQNVSVDSVISTTGDLSAKVKYTMRGDNELLLRVAFHQTPKDKWKDVAQLLAIADGFRGEISNVTASDPYQTKEPFQVEYQISQAKFVDWSKKPVRIPALLPAPGLPDPPSAADLASGKPIDLGTPLAIVLEATIHLPDRVTAQVPIASSVTRDYATFSSKYAAFEAEYPAKNTTITAIRKFHFLLPEISAARAVDLNAFLHAIQSDQGQLFTLEPSAPPKP
jgi:hypothetical protein